MGACAFGQFTTAGGGVFGSSPLYTLGWDVAALGTDVPTATPTPGPGGRPGLMLDNISGGPLWQIVVDTSGAPAFTGANFSQARDFYLQRIDSGGTVLDESFDSGTFSGAGLEIEFATGDLIVFGFDVLGQRFGGPTSGFTDQYVAGLRWTVCLV